jgi:2-dehydropantoate 2-reductase
MHVERVLIAGAGGIGTVLGGFLRRAGHTVCLLGRAPHLEAIAQRGLRIDGIWGDYQVDGFELATSPQRLSGTFAAILITVKSYDTRTIAEAVVPFLRSNGVMISMQNGLGNVEIIEEVTGPERALGARVIFGAILPQPGCARVTVFADPNALGALRPGTYPQRDELAKYWASALDVADIPTIYSERLEAVLWAKVFYNAALNPLSALLNLHYGALPDRADSRALMDAAIEEAFTVATAEGVELPWPSADAYRNEFYERLVPITFDHRSSMLQDLERGRQTEIDAINGEVWRRARAHGIVAPVNEVLTRLVRLRAQPHGLGT